MTIEGLVVAAGGALGCVLVVVMAANVLSSTPKAADLAAWCAVGAALAVVLSLVVVSVPVVLDARWAPDAGGVGPHTRPLWERAGLDIILLGLAGSVSGSRPGAATSSYWYRRCPRDFRGLHGIPGPGIPVGGILLLVVRLTRVVLTRGKPTLSRWLAPLLGRMAPWAASSLAHDRDRIAHGTALAALAIAFATSTALFNATYDAQARVDAGLTNGADVTVTGSAAAPAEAALQTIAWTHGLRAAEPMIHRFAYVGNDLQDIYGIDPARIRQATTIADAYFANQDAAGALAALAAAPDAILVSQETVNDYQLAIGDALNIRLQDARTHQIGSSPSTLSG